MAGYYPADRVGSGNEMGKQPTGQNLGNMVFDVSSTTLAELAINVSVKHANLLRVQAGIIPPILFHSLLLASVKTNRILSIQSLLLSWPLRNISLANCVELSPEHVSMMAHCFQAGCRKLREVDLSGCNTGIQGTTLLLRLATGRVLPQAKEYVQSSRQSTTKVFTKVAQDRFHLTADCYIDKENFPMFMEVLDNLTVLDFNVSCLHAIELGSKRIRRLLKKIELHQAKFVVGLNFEMNGLPPLKDPLTSLSNTTEQQQQKSAYCFTAFNSFCNLKYLNLSGNIIGEFVIFMILKNISDKTSLTHLFLNSCNIGPGPHYITQISELTCIPKLEHLELANNRLERVENFMKLFLKCSNTLLHLNLEMNGFRQDSLSAIQKLLKAPFQMKKLCIGKNQISPNDLQHLNMSFCDIQF